ncbi:MAG: hypothetical protein EXX96DRAFT_548700 [Benjaminiella poitrasii]|nr:MAG: hypothetical protein EXX96DRAFT_548700 [Benjaminiella poitrasii]
MTINKIILLELMIKRYCCCCSFMQMRYIVVNMSVVFFFLLLIGLTRRFHNNHNMRDPYMTYFVVVAAAKESLCHIQIGWVIVLIWMMVIYRWNSTYWVEMVKITTKHSCVCYYFYNKC